MISKKGRVSLSFLFTIVLLKVSIFDFYEEIQIVPSLLWLGR